MSKHVINRENVESHLALSRSPDQENFNVLLGIIKNSDIEQSLPWVMVMLKEFSLEQRKLVAEECKDMVNVYKHINYLCNNSHVSTNLVYVTMNTLSNIYKDYAHIYEEAQDYLVLVRFNETMESLMIEWGFEFMNKYKLEIKKKTNESESIK